MIDIEFVKSWLLNGKFENEEQRKQLLELLLAVKELGYYEMMDLGVALSDNS